MWWARLPLPFRLNHVNVWLLDEGSGWTVVDCGADTPGCHAAWDGLRETVLGGRPIQRVICTHGHTDHVGGARRLVEEAGRRVAMSREEWLLAHQRHRFAHEQLPADAIETFRDWGCTEDDIAQIRASRRELSRSMGAPPDLLDPLRGGSSVTVGGRTWSIVQNGGHASAHLAFHCAAEGLLIAGDQVLPSITPSILVDPQEPDGEPLRDYFETLKQFGDLAGDPLVLPGHGRPFAGLRARLAEIGAHHESRLDAIEGWLEEPRSAREVAYRLFPKAFDSEHRRHALAETVAHLNELLRRGRIERRRGRRAWSYRAL